MDPKDELLNAGLEGYLRARQAIGEFERIVSRLAKRLMIQHINDLRLLLDLPNLDESRIQENIPPEQNPDKNGVGASLYSNDFSLHWGIRWDIGEENSDTKPLAFLAVRLSATYKQTNLAMSLAKNDYTQLDITFRNRTGVWPYEVEFLKSLPEKVTESQLAEALETVILSSLNLLKAIPRGIKLAILNK